MYKKLLQWDTYDKEEMQNVDVCKRLAVSEEVAFSVRPESS